MRIHPQKVARHRFFGRVAWLLLLIISGCGGHAPKSPDVLGAGTGEKEEKKTGITTDSEMQKEGTENGPLRAKAMAFDHYANGEMTPEEVETLVASCRTNADENIFCSTILNYVSLEKKAKAKIWMMQEKKNARQVRPRFVNRHLKNWLELRYAPISRLLRGISASSPSELNRLKELSLKETKCPNNAAVAVAVTLEDQLPDSGGFKEIARLFEKGADCILDNDSDRETMLTRGGLFFYSQKQFERAMHLFEKATQVADAFTARPLYWLYRSRLALGNTAAADSALDQLESRYPFSFHTIVALTAARKDPGEILSRPNNRTKQTRSQQSPTVNILIEQLEILHRFGLEHSAAKLIDWVVNDAGGIEPGVRLYLAELKSGSENYRSQIVLLTDILYKNPELISRETMELYFPKVYFPIFEKHASGVDPYLLLAIARRESAFNTRAISSANAQGLLQLLPSTKRRFSYHGNLMDPDTNIEIGSQYVLELLKKVNGQIHLALAAYNAGPGRLNSWTARYPVEEPILFIDMIPFRETREYVASVLRNYYWYRRIHLADDKLPTPWFDSVRDKNG